MTRIKRFRGSARAPFCGLLAAFLTVLPRLGTATVPQVQAAPLLVDVARPSEPAPSLQVPPSSVRVSGPRTVYTGDVNLYSATVYPADVTLPITHTWQATDQSTVSTTRPFTTTSRSYSWSTPGTKYIRVIAENAHGTTSGHTWLEVVPKPMPDLVVTDLWYEGTTIYYQLLNQGDAEAPAGHTTQLSVDSTHATHLVNRAIPPGKRLTVLFSSTPACTGSSDTVRVTADRGSDVDESNELNNSRQEVWYCDRVPPIITERPRATGITQEQATVTWETNEPTSSGVYYDAVPGRLGNVESSITSVISHVVTLTGLRPGTVYEFKTRSQDAGKNTVDSAVYRFETLPAATVPPSPTISMARAPDMPGYYRITAELTDTTNIDRVEFRFNGELIGTDYGAHRPPTTLLHPSAPDTSKGNIYQMGFSPSSKGYTRDTFFEIAHNLQVDVVVATVGYASYVQEIFDKMSEPIEVELQILQPPPDYILGIDESTTMPVSIFALQYEWACSFGATCGDVASPPAAIEVFLDGSPVVTVDPASHSQNEYQVDIPVSPSDPSPRTLRVEVTDDDGGTESVEQQFTIVDTAPQLSISRSVVQTGNYFEVTLTIANDASAIYAASVDYVIDHYKGFQAASKETSQYKVIPIYDRQTGKSTVRIDFLGGQGCIHINPGSQYQVTYELVPVLYEGNTVRHVGQYDLKLKLLDEAEAEYPIGIHLLTNASANAIDDADYVIVTNPDRLSTHAYDIWTTWNSPNDVLAEMAHLAVLRNGVLGYLATADDETVLDALVSTNGGWTQQLHPDFAAPGLGYMLIVGESDVVPAWRSDALNIDLSDHPYSVRLWPVTGSSTDIEVPSLIVGRVPGNDCDDLVKPLQTSIRVAEGETGYGIDRSEALVYSGMVEDRFFNNASDLAPMADAQLGTVNLFHQREYVISYTIPPIAWDVEPHDRIGAGNLFGYIKDYIAYANISDEEIIVTDWDGNWVVGGQFSVPGLQAGDQMAIGDVDGDGLEEIVVGLGQTGDIWVFEGDGTVVSSFFASFDPYDGLTTGDTDDDGEEEIIRAGVSAANNLRVYDSSGGLEHLLTVEYGAHYGLAAGETTGGAPARIFVIRPDTSAEDKGEIKVYAIQAGALVELSSHERRFREGGSILTANVLGQSDDEVLVGDDENVHGKYDSLYVLGEWGGSVAEETPRVFVDAYFGLGAGDLDGDGDEDIIIANPQSDQIEVLDVSFATTMYNDVTPTLPGTDLVVYRGHGHPGYMGVLHTGRATPDFGNSNPVVFAPTCLAGFYEPDPTINWNSDFGMAEWSFEGGAGVYAGATEVSYPDPNFAGVSHFVQNWDADDDVGYTFLSTEWEVGFVGGNDYWLSIR